MHLLAVVFAVKTNGLFARLGILDPVTWMLKGMLWLAEGSLALSALYGLMMLVNSGRTGTDEEGEERGSVGWVLGVGWVVAAVVAWWVCRGPFLLPGAAGVRQASIYIGATVGAGSAAVWVSWGALETRPSLGPARLSWMAAAGWGLLPCVMMLALGHSTWALVAATATVVVAVVSLRRIVPERQREDPARVETLGSLYGMRLGPSGWRSAALLAAGAQAAMVLAVASWMVAASLLWMAAAGTAAWRWSAALRRRRGPRERVLQARAVVAAVSSLAVMLLIQGFAPRLGLVAGAPALPVVKAEERPRYFSVVLLPPPVKKEDVRAPQARRAGMRASAAEPVVIPFDGAYWYFQPPLLRPDAVAHVAHGQATQVNVHSVGDDALLMEAHQMLLRPIELDCCREIDVAVTNAETRAGQISLAVVLRDSSSRVEVMLPAQALASSQGTISARRAPVEEVVRFAVDKRSRAKGPRRFDEVDVLVLPEWEWSRAGTKLAIRSFTLLP